MQAHLKISLAQLKLELESLAFEHSQMGCPAGNEPKIDLQQKLVLLAEKLVQVPAG
jgi:hypothetical protein